jgi:hypothetical protein
MKKWDRMPGEDDISFAAFTIFRDLGPKRSFPVVAEQLEVDVEAITVMAYKYFWKTRASEWDDYIDKGIQLALRREVENRRISIMAIGEAYLKHFYKVLQTNPHDIAMTPKNFVEVARLMIDLDKLTGNGEIVPADKKELAPENEIKSLTTGDVVKAARDLIESGRRDLSNTELLKEALRKRYPDRLQAGNKNEQSGTGISTGPVLGNSKPDS